MAERLGRIDLSQSKLAGAEQIMQRPGEGPKPERRTGGKRGGKPIAPGADRRLAGLIGAERPEYRRAGGAFGCGAVT
jgi:hypothetical protein